MPELSLDERVLLLEERQTQALESLHELKAAQQQMLLELTKYRGLWGGVMLVLTALGIVLSFFKDWVFSHLKS